MKTFMFAVLLAALAATQACAQDASAAPDAPAPSAFELACREAAIAHQQVVATITARLAVADQALAAERYVDADWALRDAATLLNPVQTFSPDELTRLGLELKRLTDLYQRKHSEYLRVREAQANQQRADRDRAARESQSQTAASPITATLSTSPAASSAPTLDALRAAAANARQDQNARPDQAADEPYNGLEKRLDLKLTQAPLSSALQFLSEASGVPIIADPRLKDDTGKSLDDEQITVQLTAQSVEQILNLILPPTLGWRVEDDDHVVISSKEKANPLVTRIYPVLHLVIGVPDFGATVPRIDIGQALQQGAAGGGGGGGGVNLFAASTAVTTDKPEQKLIELLQKFVVGGDGRVAAWDSAGGQATIQYFNGMLIVSQTQAGHLKLVELLARL